jgi:hypothetical protein
MCMWQVRECGREANAQCKRWEQYELLRHNKVVVRVVVVCLLFKEGDKEVRYWVT